MDKLMIVAQVFFNPDVLRVVQRAVSSGSQSAEPTATMQSTVS